MCEREELVVNLSKSKLRWLSPGGSKKVFKDKGKCIYIALSFVAGLHAS